ncbi:MAG: hypothetical protein MRY78_09205 [Saprospiraceae bacterium]|nr:hypothetical protein [Saprospiraceae bacterium]
MQIEFVAGADIDKVKWNSCIHYASNGNIFAYKWYLDHVAKDWDALIEGDYESVFPLVWRTNMFGKKELYQPSLMRELGIYSINVLSQTRVKKFLENIPEEYQKVDIHLNERNAPPEDAGFKLDKKTNHQLFLGQPYEILQEGFDESLKQKLDAPEMEDLVPASGLKPEKIADFYIKHAQKYNKNRETDFHALQRIMYNVLHRGWGFATGVMNTDQELLAANFFVYSHNRIMSLVPMVSPKGKAQNALLFLMDLIIRTHANRQLILDFNTMSENALAKQFNALPTKFYRLHKNERVLGIF